MSAAEDPLGGIRVLDLTTSYAGPTATSYLADLGADVVKVERPGGDDARHWGPPFRDGESAWFHACNRNKRSVILDVHQARDRRHLDELLERADVLVESYNPAKLAAIGLEPVEICARYPRLIYCAISGHGLRGPDSERPGYDLTAQARTGIMSVTGAAGGPPERVSTALCDIVAGTIAAFTIAAAVVRQRASGQGGLIDVSLIDAGLSLMAPRLASYLAGEPEPAPSGATDSVLAIYQRFDTADRPIVLAVGNDRMWTRLCNALDLAELVTSDTSTNAGRRARRDRVLPALQQRLLERPASAWLRLLDEHEIPASPVQFLSEVVADEQVRALRAIGELSNGLAYVGPPWRLGLSRDGHHANAVGRAGGDTAEVFSDWLGIAGPTT